MSFRAEKARARLDLHREMSIEALYYAPNAFVGQAVKVRVHDSSLGQPGSPAMLAELVRATPSIIFLLEEVEAPARNGKVIVSATEGYEIVNVLPARDDLTVEAECTRMGAARVSAYPPP